MFKARQAGGAFSVDDLVAAFRRAWVSEGFLSREHEELRLKEGERTLARFFEWERAHPLSPDRGGGGVLFRGGPHQGDGAIRPGRRDRPGSDHPRLQDRRRGHAGEGAAPGRGEPATRHLRPGALSNQGRPSHIGSNCVFWNRIWSAASLLPRPWSFRPSERSPRSRTGYRGASSRRRLLTRPAGRVPSATCVRPPPRTISTLALGDRASNAPSRRCRDRPRPDRRRIRGPPGSAGGWVVARPDRVAVPGRESRPLSSPPLAVWLLGGVVDVRPFLWLGAGLLPLVPAVTGFGAPLLFFSGYTVALLFAILLGWTSRDLLAQAPALAPLSVFLISLRLLRLRGQISPRPGRSAGR